MVLSAKDLVSKKPIIKKPKTFNPVGAILTGISLAGAHSLTVHIFKTKDIQNGYFAFAIILYILTLLAFYATISLSAKYLSFIYRVESPPKKLQNLMVEYTLIFYIGIVPSYGFTIAYSTSTLTFERILISLGIVLVGFLGGLVYNVYLMIQKEVRLGHLLQAFFQVKKGILIALDLVIVALSTIPILL